MYNDTIKHFGVRGQKWGIRRYQNKDGSLTPEGRDRYNKSSDDSEKNNNSSGDSKKNSRFANAFTQNIKAGKDKSPISAAEKIVKESERAIDNSVKLSNAISKARQKDGMNSKQISNDELRAAIERMRLEEAYNELSARRINKGKNSITDMLSMAGNIVAIAGSIVGIASTIKTLKG